MAAFDTSFNFGANAVRKPAGKRPKGTPRSKRTGKGRKAGTSGKGGSSFGS